MEFNDCVELLNLKFLIFLLNLIIELDYWFMLLNVIEFIIEFTFIC